MFKLLMLIGLGVGGYFVAKKYLGAGSSAPSADDLYGSADIHSVADRGAMS